MYKKYNMFVLLVIFLSSIYDSASNYDVHVRDSQRSLTRKKRYLTFPEGSSLQLVFCWVVPIVGMPNIFTMGITLAVAWQLPDEPYNPFKKPAKDMNRRVDLTKKKNSGGWIVDETYAPPYKKTQVPNRKGNSPNKKTSANWPVAETHAHPNRKAEAPNRQPSTSNTKNWSSDETYSPPYLKYQKVYNEPSYIRRPPVISSKFDYFNYHKPVHYNAVASSPSYRTNVRRKYGYNFRPSQRRGDYYKDNFSHQNKNYRHPIYDEVHRRTRRDFLATVEKVLTSMKSSPFGDEDEYDLAANKEHNCSEMFPTCSFY